MNRYLYSTVYNLVGFFYLLEYFPYKLFSKNRSNFPYLWLPFSSKAIVTAFEFFSLICNSETLIGIRMLTAAPSPVFSSSLFVRSACYSLYLQGPLGVTPLPCLLPVHSNADILSFPQQFFFWTIEAKRERDRDHGNHLMPCPHFTEKRRDVERL